MTTSYPLAWPEGWPRTPAHARQDSKYRFTRGSGIDRRLWTFAAARDGLSDELGRIKARNVVLSTNFELRLDGQPSARAGNPHDQGIAVYFVLKGRPMVMACDMHLRAEENMRSLTLALEAMRQLERHGGGIMTEKAFSGFIALPAPPKPHEILGISAIATAEEIQRAHRIMIRTAHPDQGGSPDAAAKVNAARDDMLKALQA